MPVLLLLGLLTAVPASADVVSGGTLTSGTAVTGTVSTPNRDIEYTFAGTSGTHVTLDVTASNWGTGNARLYVFTPVGGLYVNCAIASGPTSCDFTPNTTGTWKVLLDPNGTAVGSATFVFANDQVKGALSPATPISTSITIKGQNAGYTLAATSGLRTVFDVSAASWNGPARLSFHTPAGALFTYCNVPAGASLCEFTPNVTGTWKVVLDPTGNTVGSATFSFGTDVNKGQLTPGAPITTAVPSKGVKANYTFPATSGVQVTFAVSAANWTNGQAAQFYFYPPSGLPLYFTCGAVTFTMCTFTPNSSGNWRAVLDPNDTAVGSTTFTFDADQAPRALTAGTPLSTTVATRGQNASFTFAGTAGVHETIDVTASNWGGGEANLNVFGPSGEQITYCALKTGPTYCDFVPTATGTWRLVLDPQGAAVGSTTLALVHDQAKGQLTVNTPISTAISVKGQNANYTFTASAGVPTSFVVSATNWGAGGATLYFYQPNGNLYDYCNFASSPTGCYFTPDVGGTWKVLLDPYEDAVGSATFKYQLN